MPHGKKAASKTPMDAYVDGCRATSISTGHPTRKSRRSSSRPTSRPANASGSRRHSKPCLPSLERTFKSASLNRVALRSGIQAPYLAGDCIGANAIRLGDAALSIDPISSSGVQKAIQSALSGAIVANTLLRRPYAADLAMRFYRDQLSDASERHRRWAADHYGTIAANRGGQFWTERSKGREAAESAPAFEPVDARAMAAVSVEVSPEAAFVETPCLDGEFVGVAPALRHPRLETPVAYLAGRALAPLLKDLPPGRTPLQIARAWSIRMPLESGLAIAGWLINHGVLVRTAEMDGGRPC